MSVPEEQRSARGLLMPALLAVQAVGIGIWLQASGRLVPELVNDSASYIDFPWTSAEAILNNYRTPGYPAFLRFCRLFGSQHEYAPLLQYLAYCLAAGTFQLGMARLTGAPGVACIAASSLLYSRI